MSMWAEVIMCNISDIFLDTVYIAPFQIH